MKTNFSRKPVKNKVRDTLRELRNRVPGRITAQGPTQQRTFIACQLMKIGKDEIVIQIGRNAYEIPIPLIQEIRHLKNPIEVERKTGVDAVIAVRDWTLSKKESGDTAPKGEVPFPLVKSPQDWNFSKKDQAVLQARTERWMRLNGLLSVLTKGGRGVTAYEGCTVATQGGSGNFVCDTYDTN